MIYFFVAQDNMLSLMGKSPLLVADLSDALLDLIIIDDSIVDAVEVGPWLTIEQVTAYRRKLPDLPFIFHATNLIVEVGENLGVEERIQEYLDYTGSPWVSVHLMVWEAEDFNRLMHGERIPLPDPEKALNRLLRRLDRLVKLVPVPVLIENIEPLPFDGYDFWSRPEFICRALERSGCGFLLDTGHLRVSANRLGIPVETFLGQLPLERVIEVHVSGPRRREGRLVDAHEPMQTMDYKLLERFLSRQLPQAVTLEYIRDQAHLSKQLDNLRKLPGLKSSWSKRNVI
jgi:uncharacterized protein (UPF0276 family)